MKKHTKTLTIIIILMVAIIMFASFFGVYKTNENGEKENILRNLKLGMEFEETRIISMSVNNEVTKTIYDKDGNIVQEEEGVEYTEEAGYTINEQKINSDSLRNVANYEKAKKIVEERLKGSNISEYFIDLNELTGKMTLEIPENENADNIQNILENSGSFILRDGETLEVVFDTSYFKKADVVTRQSDVETGVFLQLTFNEEGIKKLQELNNIYVETSEEQTTEDGETKTVTNSKVVWVFLNDAFIGTTVLPNITYNDNILLPFAISNDSNELSEAVKEAQNEAMLLNSGTLPLTYDYSNEVSEASIDQLEMLVFFTAIGLVFLVAYIYLVIKFKAKGFISVYFQIGFLGVLLLILRLTNVILTMEGMAGIIISMILEYVFTYIVLKNLESEKDGMYKKANLEFFLNTLPIYVISVVFTFATRTNVNSFGMALFWGIITIYVYNFIFPKFIFENLSGRSK